MMSFDQQDLGRCPRLPKSQTSNTYLSFTDQDVCKKIYSDDHWQFCETVTQRPELEVDSLSSQVGLLRAITTQDNSCSYPLVQEEDSNVRNVAIYLKAFALVYILPEVDWTAEKIEMLLTEGTDLFRASSEMDMQDGDEQTENEITQPESYSDEKRIKRKFNLEGHTFTLALEPRYLGEATSPLEQHPRHTIRNLRGILQNFFKSRQYCLLLSRVGTLLVWRRRKVFFVLDVNTKGRGDLPSDKVVVRLVRLKTIDNVVQLAKKLSVIRLRDAFTIRELMVVRLETPDGRLFMRDSSHRQIELNVANKSYAYLKASLHLSLHQNDTVKHRSGLMVAVGSILASKVYHPSNWNSNMLDRLVCYGVELCRNFWSDCLRDRRPIDLDMFPTQLRMGQFVMELKLLPNVKTGHWNCDICIIGTSFEAHVREAFKKYNNVVFQINSQMYAMWAKDDFYYLLDPYQHSVVGAIEGQFEGGQWASLRMFRDQLTLLSVFHQLLKESNRQSAYYMHVVRIRNLAECPKGFALAPLTEDMDTFDVQSVNEPILFGDQPGVSVFDKFQKEISDYEDEEKLWLLLKRQNAAALEAQKNVIPTTKVLKSKTKNVRIAMTKKPGQTATKSTTVGQQEASKKPIILSQESPRRTMKKLLKSPRNPANSVASSILSRQKGGRSPEVSPANPRFGRSVKWSTKESAIMNIGESSEPRTIRRGEHSAPKEGPIQQSETISPQTAVGDSLKQSMEPSNSLGVALNKDVLKAAGCRIGGVEELPERDNSLLRFPGFNRVPQLLAVAGSQSGTEKSLKRQLNSAFKVANRVLTMTPWGNYVVFRHRPICSKESEALWFYLFDGCTCDINRIRHLDLSKGTAGLIAFRKLSDVVCHLIKEKALKKLHSGVMELEPSHKGEAKTIGS